MYNIAHNAGFVGKKEVNYTLRAAITSAPTPSAPRTIKGRLADLCVGAGVADGDRGALTAGVDVWTLAAVIPIGGTTLTI